MDLGSLENVSSAAIVSACRVTVRRSNQMGASVRNGARSFFLAVLTCIGLCGPLSHADDDPASRANAAVSNILFDYDADQFASFAIRDDGFVDITFARNTPDVLYAEMINKLRAHPDIKGVLPGKGGPVCSQFN